MSDNLEALLAASIYEVERKKMATANGVNGAAAALTATAALPGANGHQRTFTDANGSTPDVYRAIAQVAKEISRDGIAKGRRNDQQGYGFRGIDDIMNALSALLAGADLIVLPRMRQRQQEERQTLSGKPLFYVTVRADYVFVSARDGSHHTVTMYGEAMDSADKATNKAMSAAYKYAMLQAFCIPTEAMGDADQTTPEPAPRTVAPIDTGGHPMNTREAQQYVAEQKIDVLVDGLKMSGEFKRAFAGVRPDLGESQFLAHLERYGVTGVGSEDVPIHKFKNTAEARKCLKDMLADLRKGAA